MRPICWLHSPGREEAARAQAELDGREQPCRYFTANCLFAPHFR
jgi:hypothetical protein